MQADAESPERNRWKKRRQAAAGNTRRRRLRKIVARAAGDLLAEAQIERRLGAVLLRFHEKPDKRRDDRLDELLVQRPTHEIRV